MHRLFLAMLLIVPLFVVGKQHTVSGYIMQQSNRETLMSAYVTDTLNLQKTISNQSGFYSISLPEGKVCLKASYIGYNENIASFRLEGDTVINFYLKEKDETIGEVTITAETPIHEQTLMGKTLIPIEKVIKTPSFAGVPDLLKAITTIPGISSGSEGRSNIYVRGGDRGQNLILLDGAKLYNTNHIGGFVSLFNADIIKQVEVYKSGFPSRYGGRASSVIDITTRDGNREKLQGKFSLGILNSSVSVDGPIGKKVSFNAGLRTTYYDLFTIKSRLEYGGSDDGTYFGYTFYDANAKLTYYVSDKHRAFVNFYSGNDYNKSKYKDVAASTIATEEISDYNIYNSCVTLGDRLTLSSKTIWQNSFTFSRYKNMLGTTNTDSIYGGKKTTDIYNTSTSIAEYNLQSRIEYYTSKHTLKGGAEYSNYHFVPGISHTYNENSGSGQMLDTIQGYTTPISSNEFSLYVEDDIDLGHSIYMNMGIRGVLFSCNGYNYMKAEPRISLRAMLGKNVSFKANYTVMNQFNHVIVSSSGIFEKEIWITSTEKIPPQQAQQISFGIFGTALSSKIELSVEAYYKRMTNLLEYKSASVNEIAITSLENLITKGGKGDAYGMEFQSKYTYKKFSIDASYILSWNYRQFDELNKGEQYPFLYDRRHQFSILASCVMGKHYSVNTNFVFATGSPYTIPEAYIKRTNGSEYAYYALSGINNYRMPNYHRLDVALVKRELTKHGRVQQFTLNIYNIYARQNPASIFFRDGKLYQTSLFTIVPTISYTLEF